MPIYEYRCPRGHTFEMFQRMSDPPPADCQICGSAPVEKVLYPAAIHFKGSGFYSTDYGRGARKKDAAKDGDGPSEGVKKDEKKDKPPEKKAAEA
jgi:putative FmdB family regulatory protein